MTTLRSGASQNYSANWGAAFGEKKTASAKPKKAKQPKVKVAKKAARKKINKK